MEKTEKQKSLAFSFFIIFMMAVVSGALRQLLPNNLSWIGSWPTSETSAEEAYHAFARENDPPFISLTDAQAYSENKSAVFIDARTIEEFQMGHIPGARSLPFYAMNQYQEEALEGIYSDTKIIVYCEGIGCELSFFLGRELQLAGYTNVHIFYGGYPEWIEADLPIEK